MKQKQLLGTMIPSVSKTGPGMFIWIDAIQFSRDICSDRIFVHLTNSVLKGEFAVVLPNAF